MTTSKMHADDRMRWVRDARRAGLHLIRIAAGAADDLAADCAAERLVCAVPQCRDTRLVALHGVGGEPDAFVHAGDASHPASALAPLAARAVIVAWLGDRHPDAEVESSPPDNPRIACSFPDGRRLELTIVGDELSPATWRAAHEAVQAAGVSDLWLLASSGPHAHRAFGEAERMVLDGLTRLIVESGAALIWLDADERRLLVPEEPLVDGADPDRPLAPAQVAVRADELRLCRIVGREIMTPTRREAARAHARLRWTAAAGAVPLKYMSSTPRERAMATWLRNRREEAWVRHRNDLAARRIVLPDVVLRETIDDQGIANLRAAHWHALVWEAFIADRAGTGFALKDVLAMLRRALVWTDDPAPALGALVDFFTRCDEASLVSLERDDGRWLVRVEPAR